jgi:hypothetical protein
MHQATIEGWLRWVTIRRRQRSRGAFAGDRGSGEFPAVGVGKLGLHQDPQFVGGVEVLLRRTPAVMADVVEPMVFRDPEPAPVFLAIDRRRDGVRVDAVVAVTAEKRAACR